MALMCKHPELSHASFDSLIAIRSRLSNNMNDRLLTKVRKDDRESDNRFLNTISRG